MTEDELNALQYAAGYVPHALLKKYEKRSGEKYAAFTECLGDMAVGSEDTSDFLEYTKVWINKVNRGGLFPLNNITFIFC
jgi:coiled-coil and C2 domain-containing protein 1